MQINTYRVTMRIGNDKATTSTEVQATCEGDAMEIVAATFHNVKEIVKAKKVD